MVSTYLKERSPSTYPHEPIKIRFLTTTGSQRFNPNLYDNGKVCLSIINTWKGPGWTPSNTVRSIILTLLSHVFVKFPMKNEPGFEFPSKKTEWYKYNKYLVYKNFEIALNSMLIGSCDLPCDGFKNIIENYVFLHKDWYLSTLDYLISNYQNKSISSPFFSKRCKCDYLKVKNIFQKYLLDNIIPKYIETEAFEIPFKATLKLNDYELFNLNKKKVIVEDGEEPAEPIVEEPVEPIVEEPAEPIVEEPVYPAAAGAGAGAGADFNVDAFVNINENLFHQITINKPLVNNLHTQMIHDSSVSVIDFKLQLFKEMGYNHMFKKGKLDKDFVNLMTKQFLTKICSFYRKGMKKKHWKGYSKLNKKELVQFIMDRKEDLNPIE